MLVRKFFIACGVLAMLLMGVSAAAVATSVVQAALYPHDEVLHEATQFADQARLEE